MINNFRKLLKRKNSQKPWETLIISENLSWDQFSKINFYLHELNWSQACFICCTKLPIQAKLIHMY